jgi:hypothetical protein
MEGENVEGQWEDLGLVEGGVPGVGNGWMSARVNPDPLDPLYAPPHPSLVNIFDEITGHDTAKHYQKRSMNLVKFGNETQLRILRQPAFSTEYSNAHFV